ncbi:ABC transporter substrate-binding protein [Streptomyces sp. CoT10]|uniref:ABC transporter substrate-binding protein n=1 Tax=Streptomyces sp. CoT10 TaxID=2875762 RepID=UPI001CD5E209|nr:ABC transporter substrate-binding protein [Streptomyces sp. CoT10]
MIRGTRKRAAVVMVTLCLALSACTMSTDTASSNHDGTGPITIGFIGGMSGVFAPYEKPALDGAELAVKEINAAGGVDGRPLKLVTEDNKSDINESARAGQAILDDGAVASLVPVDLNYGGGAAQVIQGAGKIAMSVGGGSTQWAKFGPLVYNVGTTATSDGAAMAQFAHDKGIKDAYLMVDTISDFSQELCDGFKTRFTELGGRILGSDTFNNKDTSLGAQITRMKSAAPQPGIIANCSFPPGGALMVKQLRDAGIDSPLISSNGMDGDFWFKNSMPNLSGVYTVDWASVWGDDPAPGVNKLVKDLATAQGSQPQNQFGVTGYIAVKAIVAAMQKAGSTDGDKVAAALNSFKREDVGIPLTFDKDFHMDRTREYRILQVVNGRPKFVTTVKTAGN